MGERSQSSGRHLGSVWLVVAVAMLLLAGGYVAWYFFGALNVYRHHPLGTRREYSSSAVARLFVPMAWLEAQIKGESVGVESMKDPLPMEPYADPFEFYYVAQP